MCAATEQEILSQGAEELKSAGSARLWLLRLDVAELHDALFDLLSPDERERAALYPSATRGQRFARARGLLRILLGRATDSAPADVRFEYGCDGKPSLASHAAVGEQLHFNLSHARDLALVALSQEQRVGADLAWTDGHTRFDHVAARFFSAREQAALAASEPHEQRAVFWRIWVRKEAYLKGRGEGISERIYETDFAQATLAESSQRGLDAAWTADSVRRQDEWECFDVEGLPSGYVGSVSVERRSRSAA